MRSLFLTVAILGQVAFGQPPQAPPDDPRPRAPMAEFAQSPEAVPTPLTEVVRVIGLLPKPAVGFVDFGCGSDARWCVVAAERWGCKATGIEIDPDRAAAARRRVQEAGLAHLITIVEGDAITTDVQADVGVAYLYADALEQLRPRLEKLRAFASYLHQPPGLPSVKNGDSWIYAKAAKVAPQARAAVWGGQTYTHPVCNNPNCGMCASIRAQLAAPVTQAKQPAVRLERRKFCDGRRCWFADVWVAD